MIETKKWFIVYTRPGQEKKVTESLNRKKIECFCPLSSTTYQPLHKKKTAFQVLFCCYSFAKICESQIPELRKINGVINLVFWLNRPFVVPDHEINIIKEFVNDYQNVTLEKVGIDEKVRFSNNILAENKDLRIYTRNNTGRVILPALGYIMTGETTTAATIEVPVSPLLPRLRSIMDKIVG